MISQVLLVLLILTYPLGIELLPGVRPVDFVVIGLIIQDLSRNGMKAGVITWLAALFFVSYACSTIYGLLTIGLRNPAAILFVYKYALVFLLFAALLRLRLTTIQIERTGRMVWGVFVFLVAYVFIHIYLVVSGHLTVNIRPSFPLSTGPDWSNDAHLYSAFISSGIVALMLYRAYGILKINVLPFGLLIGTSIVALLLTGSRTGVVSLLLTLAFWGMLAAGRAINIGRFRIRNMAGLLVVVTFMSILAMEFAPRRSPLPESDIVGVVDRALTVGVGEQSVQNRFAKIQSTLEAVASGPMVVGVGMQSFGWLWVDNGIVAVLASGGLVGFLALGGMIAALLIHFCAQARRAGQRSDFWVIAVLFLNYMLSNIASEYFLVLRSFVPFALFVMIPAHRLREGASTKQIR